MQHKQSIILKIGLAVICAGVFVFGFFYLFNEINAKNDTAATLSDQYQSESDRRSTIASLNSEVKAIAPQRALLESHFANASDVVPFLDDLQALAVSAGATAEVSSLDDTKDATGLDVEIKAEGSFASLHTLLALLQNSQYELSFSSVKFDTVPLSPTGKVVKGGNQTWEATFDITLLSFETQ